MLLNRKKATLAKLASLTTILFQFMDKMMNLFKSSGKRIKRGLFKTSNGLLINADINGSLNIMRKYLNEVCDEIISPANRGLVMNPVKI